MRYLAGVRRQQTHLPREAIRAWLPAYPHLRAFILGYQVHCLLDEIDLARVVGRALHFNLLSAVRRRGFSGQQMAALVELRYLQRPLLSQRASTAQPVSGAHNPILATLGILPEHSAALSDALREYLAAPSFQSALRAFQQMGLAGDARIDRYIQAAQALEQHTTLRALLLLGVRASGLERLALEHVRRGMEGADAGTR